VLAAAIVVATLLVASLPASRRAARTDPARVLKS
jgi:ABC-type lipoprotein release transport system permease subunit